MFPGARDCLETIDRAGILMSVATAKSSKGLFATLERHDLRQFFVNLQTGDRHPGKPNPSMVLASLAEAGVDPDNAVVIGDTRFDIEMAVNAGVTPIGVAWGYHEPQSLLSAGAQEIAPDFSALARKILDRFY
jgi:phosphoglycolate phosphatase